MRGKGDVHPMSLILPMRLPYKACPFVKFVFITKSVISFTISVILTIVPITYFVK